MVIKLRLRRSSLGKRLLSANLIVLIVAFGILLIGFNVWLRVRLVNDAKIEMAKEADVIKTIVAQIDTQQDKASIPELLNRSLRLMGSQVKSYYFVLDPLGKVRFSNYKDELDEKNLDSMLKKIEENPRAYLIDRSGIKLTLGRLKTAVRGELVMVSELSDLLAIQRVFTRVLVMVAGVSILLAMFLVMGLQRRITKPIKALSNAMKKFTPKNHQPIVLQTDRELQVLVDGYNALSEQVTSYYEEQNRFFQNASHELKTPLMSIQGYAEAIKDGVVEGPEVEKSLDIIVEEANRLKRLVEELIYLSRLETDETIYDPRPCDVKNIVGSSIEAILPLAKDQHVVIESVLESFPLIMDPDKLKQAIINILGNAIRYADQLIRVEVATANNFVTITIEDDGRGFVFGEEGMVFKRFYKGVKGGSGIGLSITKAIIESSGGSVAASNRETGGARFIIRLPQSTKSV